MVSLAIGYYFKSVGCALASFAAGVFVDADHFIDYFVSYGFNLDLKKIYKVCEKSELKKIVLFLHSYEIVFMLWAAIALFSLSDLWIAIAIGLTQHLLFDQFTNRMGPLGYFLTFRIINKFEKKNIIR